MQDVRGANDKVNVLLVDDQPAKLLANEEILRSLGEKPEPETPKPRRAPARRTTPARKKKDAES